MKILLICLCLLLSVITVVFNSYRLMNNEEIVSVIVNKQDGQYGWPSHTYIKILPKGELISIFGSWGNCGDTIRQSRRWYKDKQAEF